ncbi:hypothetical protein [Spirosoma rhododendri]|uniref:hypothetical protein n=1 Tax=Spirosoma rhododendri TaxID=2728024 RepID=UPI001C2C2F6D|nr:hypothetical protein [Spirosoma rhododendri]
MKSLKIMPLLMATMMVVLLASCGPSYVGVNTRPAYGYYGRPYYNNYGYGYYNRPYGYYRPPVIVQRRTYVTPAPRYNAPVITFPTVVREVVSVAVAASTVVVGRVVQDKVWLP